MSSVPKDPGDSKKAEGSTRRPRWRSILVLTAVSLVVLGGVAGIAWFYGSSAREPELHSRQQALEECHERGRELEDRVTALGDLQAEMERNAAALQARRFLSLAIESVVERNFGMAQSQLRTAIQELRAAQQEDLADRVDRVELMATNDPGAQRDTLVDLARAVDRLIEGNLEAEPQNL